MEKDEKFIGDIISERLANQKVKTKFKFNKRLFINLLITATIFAISSGIGIIIAFLILGKF